eukprot:s2449_g1.t1
MNSMANTLLALKGAKHEEKPEGRQSQAQLRQPSGRTAELLTLFAIHPSQKLEAVSGPFSTLLLQLQLLLTSTFSRVQSIREMAYLTVFAAWRPPQATRVQACGVPSELVDCEHVETLVWPNGVLPTLLCIVRPSDKSLKPVIGCWLEMVALPTTIPSTGNSWN